MNQNQNQNQNQSQNKSSVKSPEGQRLRALSGEDLKRVVGGLVINTCFSPGMR